MKAIVFSQPLHGEAHGKYMKGVRSGHTPSKSARTVILMSRIADIQAFSLYNLHRKAMTNRMRRSREALHEPKVPMSNANQGLEGYRAPQHWTVEQWHPNFDQVVKDASKHLNFFSEVRFLRSHL